MREIYGRKYNCPNCGAPIAYSEKCEYCGMLFTWTPTIADVTLVPRFMNVRQVKVRVSADMYLMRGGSTTREDIVERLKQDLSEFLPSVWTLESEPDLERGDMCFTATIFLGVDLNEH